MFYCKINNNLQSNSNDNIVFNCNFRYSLDDIKHYYAQYFEYGTLFSQIYRIKKCTGLLFTLTQNAYLYTPVFSYALYIPVFVRIPSAYKNVSFPYSAMFYAVYRLKLKPFTNFSKKDHHRYLTG